MKTTRKERSKQPTKAELQQQLRETTQQLEQARAQVAALVDKNKFVESMRFDEDALINELHRQISELETRAGADDEKIVDLERQLAHAADRLAEAEAILLRRPATATPPAGGHAVESLYAPEKGVMRPWLFTDNEGYRVKLVYQGQDGWGWEFIKQSDGTRYHLFEGERGPIDCDCPGAMRHGAKCCNGQGCKHARMLKALRTMISPLCASFAAMAKQPQTAA